MILHSADSVRPSLAQAPRFFLAGPTKTLVAQSEGKGVVGYLNDREALIAAAECALRESGSTNRYVVGAVPFGGDTPVRLFEAEQVEEFGRFWVEADGAASVPESSRRRTRSTRGMSSASSQDQAAYLRAVSLAVERIREGALKKVVLARTLELELSVPPDVPSLIRTLHAKNPHGFTYALALSGASVADSSFLVGASPELLLSRRGHRVVSAPLAGSIPRVADETEDRLRAKNLLNSSKDRHEHALVVEQIVEALRPLTKDLAFEREPVVTATHALWHLSTRIEGRLRDESISALRLALALHPTPAVCGTPTALARQFIREAEPFDRGYFTGTLGYVDQRGDGDWIVTIRGAEVSAERVRIFAGAGIVGSSVPELELAETNAKMQTMLQGLGLAELS